MSGLVSPLRLLRNKFLKDTATLQVASMLNQASQLLASVAIAFLLGAVGQGLYFLAVSLRDLVYNLINVGVVQATISQLAAASVRDNHVKVRGWLAFLAKAFLLLNTALIGVGWLVLPWAGERFFGDRQVGVWAWWLCFWPLIDIPRAVASVSFLGTRRMLDVGKVEIGLEFMRAFLVILGAVVTGSPKGAVLGELMARGLGTLMALDLYRRARRDGGPWLPSMVSIFREIPSIPMRQGLRLGLRVGLLKNGTTLFIHVFPSLLIGGVAGAAWVAWFRVAQRIMDMPLMMMQGVSRVILPALSELAGLKDFARFRRLYTRTTLIAGLLVSAGILVCLPLVRPVVSLLYPADYSAPVFVYACILALGLIPASFAVALESFYIVTDQMKRSLIITAIGAAITIPANVLLLWLLPTTGAVWGLSLYMSWVLVHLAYVRWYFRRSEHGRSLWMEAG